MIENPETKSETSGELFSVGQIILATLIGSPLAGSLLLAGNYRELRKTGAVWRSLGLGVFSTTVVFVIALWLPSNFPNSALPFAYCFGMRQLAIRLQGTPISNHFSAGGQKRSWAIPVAAGIGSLALILSMASTVWFFSAP